MTDGTSSAARQAILARVRKALAAPSETPSWLGLPSLPGPLFPLPEKETAALRDRFRNEFRAVHGEFHEVASLAEAREWLQREIVGSGSFPHVLAAGKGRLAPLLDGLIQVQWLDADRPARERAGDELGITGCESLVAESGTIVVSAGHTGRAGTILPPVHLVIATADQLVADLDTSIERLKHRYPAGLPSTMSWITGPSRTGDIEKILVLGAHGPRRLLLLLLPADSLPTE